MQITIEKNVPISAKETGPRNGGKWDFITKMEIGDSFVFPLKNGDYKKSYRNIYAAFMNRNLRCTIRRLSENEVRVWRVSKYPKKNAKFMASK